MCGTFHHTTKRFISRSFALILKEGKLKVNSETRISIRLPDLCRKEVIYKPHTVQFITGDQNIKQGDKRRIFVTK